MSNWPLDPEDPARSLKAEMEQDSVSIKMCWRIKVRDTGEINTPWDGGSDFKILGPILPIGRLFLWSVFLLVVWRDVSTELWRLFFFTYAPDSLLLPMSLACFVPIVSKSLQSSAQCARKEETVPEDRPSCLTATPRSHGCYLFVTHFSSHRAIGQCSLVTWVSRTAGTLKKLPGQSRRKADGLRLGARAKKKETRPVEASRGWLGGCLWTLELESPNVEKKKGWLVQKVIRVSSPPNADKWESPTSNLATFSVASFSWTWTVVR